MASKKPRINIPRNVEELLTLADLVYNKHQSDGTASPLKLLQDYDWDIVGPKLNFALDKHKKAESLRREMEKAYEDRDALVGDIEGIIRSTRDLLKGVYSRTPKTLGDWGFDVDHAPKTKPSNAADDPDTPPA